MRRAEIALPWLDADSPLPPASTALEHPSHLRGLLAAGQDLSVARLREAYSQGIFPWYSDGQPVLWWSPDPRMVLRTADFRFHPSLRKTVRRFARDPSCAIRMDSAFAQVIRHCAKAPRKGQSGTWILPEMVESYIALHQAGHAHSVETWIDGELVGGLYLVSLGCALFGESMFARQTDASKIALAALVAFARQHSMPWIDCQQNTRHLSSLGAREMPRDEFVQWVHAEVTRPAPVWQFDPIYWDAL
jgi:leucyl/phenylalanyl-tRNA--protein transferase